MDQERPPIDRMDDPEAMYLCLYGSGGVGTLKLPRPGTADRLCVGLRSSLVKVLLAMRLAQLRDQELDEEMRGWTNDQQIADAMVADDPKAIAPEPGSVAAYRAQINRRVRAKAGDEQPVPAVFETRRCIGVRLARKLIVIDLSYRGRR